LSNVAQLAYALAITAWQKSIPSPFLKVPASLTKVLSKFVHTKLAGCDGLNGTSGNFSSIHRVLFGLTGHFDKLVPEKFVHFRRAIANRFSLRAYPVKDITEAEKIIRQVNDLS